MRMYNTLRVDVDFAAAAQHTTRWKRWHRLCVVCAAVPSPVSRGLGCIQQVVQGSDLLLTLYPTTVVACPVNVALLQLLHAP